MKELLVNKDSFAIFKETSKYVKKFNEFEEEQKKLGYDHIKLMNRQQSRSSIFDDLGNNEEGRVSISRPKSNRKEEFQKEFVDEAAPIIKNESRSKQESDS